MEETKVGWGRKWCGNLRPPPSFASARRVVSVSLFLPTPCSRVHIGKEPPAHIQRGKLLAAAGDVFALIRTQTQPDAVDAFIAALPRADAEAVLARDAHGQHAVHVRVREG